MIEFLEEQGYDVTYTSGSDVDANGSLLLNHKVFISSGHDEYWSAAQRANVTNARDHGVNLAFFSGNEIFWKTRWGASTDGSNTPYRTLITYKETHFNAPTDPEDPGTWTGSWEDPRFSPPADGDDPGNSLTGQYFAVNEGTTDIQVPSQYASELLWRNTAVAKLQPGQSVTLGPPVNVGQQIGTLGYEWDIDADNGFRPPGEIDLSSTTENASTPDQVFDDYGTNVVPATVTHHLSLYKAASGAYVFGAGTVQFAYGLASSNPVGAAPDPNMEQFTVNLFALMGAQPATLTAGLVPGSPSSATGPPTSTITSPAPNATLTDGAPVTITGTATDNNGGVVAGVEVSTDGGNTWHPATTFTPGTSSTWTYNWPGAHGSPTATIESRATDDSGNIETPSDAEKVDINCPCSIWGSGFTPTVTDSGSSSPVEVGVKFTSDVYGTINGIKFYKSTANTGTHIGNLWTAGGQLLASATFTGESTSGWQSVSFSKPVPILPNTTYVASYFAPKGHTADDDYYLYENPQPATMGPTVADSPPLHAVRSTATNGGNGVYTDSSSSTFPANADTGTNYWVDVSFTPQPAPGAASNVTATAGYSSATLAWSAPTTGGPSTSYTITPYVAGTAQATTTVTGSPAPTTATVPGLTNGTSYTFKVTASNPAGSAAASAPSNAVTPSATAPPVFVQQAGAQASSVKSISIQSSSPVTAGNRLLVEVAAYNGSNPSVTGVTDTAGDTFTELSSTTAPDGTAMTVWTAVVTYSGGTQPTITATANAASDMGITALEYAGLSTANGAAVLDSSTSASGTTGSSAATVSSGATAAAGHTNELALGLYADSGYSDTLTAGTGWTARSNVSPVSTVEVFTEDQLLNTGATATATVGTGAKTPWAMTALLLKPASATPPTAPSAPSNVTAIAGNGSATVSWTAPDNGGSLITSYTVTPYTGSTAGTPVTVANQTPNASTTITGLTSGTTYTFTVSATNSVGTSAASTPSNAVTPQAQSAPGTPTGVSAVAGNGSATVSWTAPPNGGTTISSYTITPYTTGESSSAGTPVTISGNPPATTATVSGLTNGTAYLFSVSATNSVGTGPESADSTQVVPAGPPLAPTGVTATSGTASATVTWTAPDPQGSPITSYTVTPFVGSTPQVPVTVSGSPPATSALMAGLTDGTSYTFQVTATNATGTSASSAPSAAVTPADVPAPPAAVTAVTAGSGSLSVSWTPQSNSGAAITSYTLTPYAGSTAGTPVTVSGSPPATSTTVTGLTNGTTYTFTATATNAVGTSASSTASDPATPVAAPETCPCTIFGSQVPATADSGDGSSVNVGTAFTTDTSGYVTGMRFYKASTNTGTHVGSLWSANGTLLAQATFSNETASGWQQVSFSAPVAVTAGTTYVVSYLAPNGHYAQTLNGLTAAADAPPLYALASANASNGNGVFTYASTTAFPVNTYEASNYWVDPVYSQTLPSIPARAYGSHRDRRQHQRHRLVDPAAWDSDLLHRHPLRRVDRGHAGDGHRFPARQHRHRDRADQRHRLHLQGHGHQLARDRTRLGGLQRRDAGRGPRRAERGDRSHSRVGLGHGLVERPGQQLDHHLLHRHPVRGVDGGHAGDGQRLPAGHLDHAERADQRHHLHLRGVGHELGRVGAGVGRFELGHARVLAQLPVQRLRDPDPEHGRLGGRLRGQPRDGLHHRHQRLHHRGPLLQGIDEHGHPRGQPVERDRHAVGPGHVLQRDGLGVADRFRSRPRSRSRPAPPTSCRTTPPRGTTRSGPASPTSSTRRPSTRWPRPTPPTATGSSSTAARRPSRPGPTTRATTTSTRSSRRPRLRPPLRLRESPRPPATPAPPSRGPRRLGQ